MDYLDFCEGTLTAALSSGTTTNVQLKLKKVNSVYPTWSTAAHQIMIVQKTRTQTKVEKCNVAAGTTQTTAGVVTLGTLTRAISLEDGTDTVGTGTAQSFTQGALVYITWTSSDAEQTVKKNEANTLTGSGAIRSSSTTTPVIRINNVTEAQRDAMTAANGDLVYNTDTGVLNQYVGGAWVAVGDAGTVDATSTVAGKVEIGAAADNAAGTDTGDSGAKVVIPTSLVVKTSSGSGDENKIPCLDSNGDLAEGFMPSAVLSKELFGDGSDGAKSIATSENLDPTAEYNYTSLTLDAGQTLSVSSVNSVLGIKVTGNATINGTIDLDGKGGGGGAGGAIDTDGTNGTAGNSKISGFTNGGGYGGTVSSGTGYGGGGGSSILANGGNANYTSGTYGTGGATITDVRKDFLQAIQRFAVCGSGGGGGRGDADSAGSAGGAGAGACIIFIGGSLTLGASSVITADGVTGTTDNDAGPGGGGGGGHVLIIVRGSITDSGVTLTATGGIGGRGAGYPGSGLTAGDGAAGKIVIFSLTDGTVITN